MEKVQKHIGFIKFVVIKMKASILNKRQVLFIDIKPGDDQVPLLAELKDIDIIPPAALVAEYDNYDITCEVFVLFKEKDVLVPFKIKFS